MPEDHRADGKLTDSELDTRLQSRSKEELIALVKRISADSPELGARVDCLTDKAAASKSLQRRITAIRNGSRFVDYRGSGELAATIQSIANDIEADILPQDPPAALALAEKLFSLDQKVFNRADDSGGSIGHSLREACVLWLRMAAAVRSTAAERPVNWVDRIYDLYQANDYGVREPLLSEAAALLSEPELRSLAARFEQDTLEVLGRASRDDFHHVFAPSSAMGLVARALRDPSLYERSTRIHSRDLNELQAADVAEHYLECGDGAGALRLLEGDWEPAHQLQRLALQDRAYALLGDTAKQIEARRSYYQKAPGIFSYRQLAEVLPESERAQFRIRACAEARSNPSLSAGAALLFVLEEPILAEELIVARSEELDGREYATLLDLADAAKAAGQYLAATLVWRALLEAILARAYSKAYGHAAAYLAELRAADSRIRDYQRHPTHAQYEQSLIARHGRKTGFWARVKERTG